MIAAESSEAGVSGAAALRDVFLRWELLRPFYNAALVALVLSVVLPTAPEFFARPSFWLLLVVGCAGANLCYLAGPCAEGYLRWLGVRRLLPLRLALFASGTLVALLLTWVALRDYAESVRPPLP